MAVPVDVMNAFQAVPRFVEAFQGEKNKEAEAPKLSEGFMLTKPRKVEEDQGESQNLQA
jgi:hypothetical protein